jgi:tight adherence protein B
VFTTCKRTGGDLVSVIRRTSNIIAEKLETEQEISVTISQKKFESKILMFAPFAFVAILTLSSGGYMDPLFNSLVGIIVMTGSLVVLGGVFWLTQWIMDIKV